MHDETTTETNPPTPELDLDAMESKLKTRRSAIEGLVKEAKGSIDNLKRKIAEWQAEGDKIDRMLRPKVTRTRAKQPEAPPKPKLAKPPKAQPKAKAAEG